MDQAEQIQKPHFVITSPDCKMIRPTSSTLKNTPPQSDMAMYEHQMLPSLAH